MGKSTVAARFRALGIDVCDADAEVHKLYEGAAVPAIEAAFPGTTENGKSTARSCGRAARRPRGFKRLEAIVTLGFEPKRAFLRAESTRGARLRSRDPMLLETGGERRIDCVIVCSAPGDGNVGADAAAGHDAGELEQMLRDR